MNIFRNHNQNKTAKEHIERKRNLNLFLDLSNNPVTNKLTRIKGKKITNVNNHSNLINLTKGFFEHYQSGKCVDMTGSLQTSYDVETFSKRKNDIIKNNVVGNVDISNVYTGILLTYDNVYTETTNDFILNSKTDNIKNYAEVSTKNGILTHVKKTQSVNCIKLHTDNFKNM